MKQEIEDRFKRNVARVKNLVSIYNRLTAGKAKGRKGHQDADTLRAATVLLHASIEDVLRSLAYWKLPQTNDSAFLSGIPLSGTTSPKLNLGNLLTFRGKTVDEVITQSINDTLEKSNYNNSTEVCGLIQAIGLSTAPLSIYLSDIENLMKRRHQIVHRADANYNSGTGQHKVSSISKANVVNWIANAELFVNNLLSQV